MGIFQAVAERLKAMFITHVALDLEAELLSQDAVRKAGLLRQADRLAAEGLDDVATELRERAGRLSLDRPLASVLPSVAELRRTASEEPLVALPAVASSVPTPLATVPSKRKKTSLKVGDL